MLKLVARWKVFSEFFYLLLFFALDCCDCTCSRDGDHWSRTHDSMHLFRRVIVQYPMDYCKQTWILQTSQACQRAKRVVITKCKEETQLRTPVTKWIQRTMNPQRCEKWQPLTWSLHLGGNSRDLPPLRGRRRFSLQGDLAKEVCVTTVAGSCWVHFGGYTHSPCFIHQEHSQALRLAFADFRAFKIWWGWPGWQWMWSSWVGNQFLPQKSTSRSPFFNLFFICFFPGFPSTGKSILWSLLCRSSKDLQPRRRSESPME